MKYEQPSSAAHSPKSTAHSLRSAFRTPHSGRISTYHRMGKNSGVDLGSAGTHPGGMKEGSRGSKRSETPGPAAACSPHPGGMPEGCLLKGRLCFWHPVPGCRTLAALDRCPGASCQYHRSADFQSALYRGFPIRRCDQAGTACRLEVGDTAGLETCATNASILATGGTGKMRPVVRSPQSTAHSLRSALRTPHFILHNSYFILHR